MSQRQSNTPESSADSTPEELHQYSLFKLAWQIPLAVSLGLACSVFIGDVLIEGNLKLGFSLGSAALNTFWEYYKVPIAVLSLAVPLAAWATADHRAKLTIASLKKQENMLKQQQQAFKAQEEKRLAELYETNVDKATHLIKNNLNNQLRIDVNEERLKSLVNMAFDSEIQSTWPPRHCLMFRKKITVIQSSVTDIAAKLSDFYGELYNDCIKNADFDSLLPDKELPAMQERYIRSEALELIDALCERSVQLDTIVNLIDEGRKYYVHDILQLPLILAFCLNEIDEVFSRFTDDRVVPYEEFLEQTKHLRFIKNEAYPKLSISLNLDKDTTVTMLNEMVVNHWQDMITQDSSRTTASDASPSQPDAEPEQSEPHGAQ